MKHAYKSIAIGAALFTLAGIGCDNTSEESDALGGIDALVILQRARRGDGGDIFQYTSYKPGARIIKLSPATADGTVSVLCCDQAGPEFAKLDITGYDLSFDAKSIVFSGKLAEDQTYGLFLLQLSDGSVTQIATDPQRDFVSPLFLPGDKVMFVTNAVVEANAPQHLDEYERGVTTQLGRVGIDGKNMEYGPRNLSHRTGLALASDGRVVFTQWDHLGGENSGHLMKVTQDMQDLREVFGKEGSIEANSVIHAREISAGRWAAIATSRDRTVNAGALVDVRLGTIEDHDGSISAPTNQSEANATYRPLTPDVPMGNEASATTVGRYYDAFPLNAKDKPDFLVSWADGPVESGVLAAAGLTADFGVYVYRSDHQQRFPILDDHNMWDISARPLRTSVAPNIVSSAQDLKLDGQMLIGSLNVYDSTLHTFKDGEIYGVRVMEGFSSEEGPPRMFGSTEFEGHANLGVAPIAPDKSWSARIPANIPVHLQTVDIFGMSSFTEPVWFSGRPGEARMCGGCHENRTKTTTVTSGQLDTFALGASKLFAATPRAARMNTNPTLATDIVGVGWDTQVQPILDAKCVSCHGDPSSGSHVNIAPYTITDPKTGNSVTWAFDLRGTKLPPGLATSAGGANFTASYYTMAGPNMEAIAKGELMITGNFKIYLNPEDARGSIAIKKLNPTQLFPTVNTSVHAFPGLGHLPTVGAPADLTSREFYMLILAAEMGVNFYARENNPHTPNLY